MSTAEITAASETKKTMKFTLMANDDVKITVDEDVAFQSNLLMKMVTDLGISDDKTLSEGLPISNVNGSTLQKILDWCQAHRGETYKPKEEHEDARIALTEEDKKYLDVTSQELYGMLMGANYLDIPGLIDIITQHIANMITDKSVEEIREIYHLVNDFSPEEEAEIKKRFEWVEA